MMIQALVNRFQILPGQVQKEDCVTAWRETFADPYSKALYITENKTGATKSIASVTIPGYPLQQGY